MTSVRDHAVVQTVPAVRDGRRPSGDLEAERDRRGGLQQRPPQHHRGCVPFREIPQRTVEPSVVGGDRHPRLLEEQHQRGVGDVLAGGSPMHVGGAGRIDEMNALAQCLDERDRRAWRLCARPWRSRRCRSRRGARPRKSCARPSAGITPAAAAARASALSNSSIAATMLSSEKIAARGRSWRGSRRGSSPCQGRRQKAEGRTNAEFPSVLQVSFSLLPLSPSAFSLVTDRRKPSPRLPASG